tara:strand:+ start:187 stop:504 length:318 start_codon:yes stop_codon:yes gene_type:complete
MLTQEELAQLTTAVRSPTDRLWDYAFKAMVPVIIAIVGWAIATDRSVAANSAEIKAHSADLGRHAVLIKSQPPEWLREVVAELKAQNTNILQRLSSIEAEVHAKK